MSVLTEKWADCVGCEYNTCKKKGRLKKDDYQEFNCIADPEFFQCPKIPEIYPEKLYDINKDNNIFNVKRIIKNKKETEQVLEAFLIELYDDIECTTKSFVVLGDDSKHIESTIKKLLNKRNYRYLTLTNIRKLNTLFKNYDVVVVPKNYKKIVYPKIDIEMDHGLYKIKIEELVMDLRHNPCFSNKIEDVNVKMNMDLSQYSKNDNNISNKEKSSDGP